MDTASSKVNLKQLKVGNYTTKAYFSLFLTSVQYRVFDVKMLGRDLIKNSNDVEVQLHTLQSLACSRT
ncbi:hypothetical protein Trydic_g8866 [Trypoxylus dichotomus]